VRTGESTNINFIVFCLVRAGHEPTIYHFESSTLTTTPPMRLWTTEEKEHTIIGKTES